MADKFKVVTVPGSVTLDAGPVSKGGEPLGLTLEQAERIEHAANTRAEGIGLVSTRYEIAPLDPEAA